MSHIERRNEFRPSSGEAPFSEDECFFSRTDPRGKIITGNYIFRRVSGYDWSELEGAPHNIIRHPDMPRGVFWLLWDRLKQGQITGAYVKNLSKDGLYYWVYAVIAPTPDGYISARIKPTSSDLAMIEAEYAVLRQAEIQDSLRPQQSAEKLLHRLEEAGYATYEEFQTQSLAKELARCMASVTGVAKNRMSDLLKATNAADGLRRETEGLVSDFRGMRTIPHNLQVIASRLEPTGGPISTLSKNYSVMSNDMLGWFETNVVGKDTNFSSISRKLLEALFVEAMLETFRMCDAELQKERRQLGTANAEHERAYLRTLVETYAERTESERAFVMREAKRILVAGDQMDRHMLGLSTTRVMCKIESGRSAQSESSLADIISQLNVFQTKISKRLETIRQLGSQIHDLIG